MTPIGQRTGSGIEKESDSIQHQWLARIKRKNFWADGNLHFPESGNKLSTHQRLISSLLSSPLLLPSSLAQTRPSNRRNK